MEYADLSQLVVAIASAVLGIFVVWQGRRAPNLTLALFSAALTLWCFGQFMGGIIDGKTAVLWWTRANIAGAVLIPIFYYHFILAFLDRTKEDRRWLIGGYLITAVLLLLDLSPWFVADVSARLGYRYYPVPGIVYPYFALYLLVFFSLGFVRLVSYLRNGERVARNQVKYVLIASLIGFLGGATAFFPVFNLDLPVISQYALPIYLLITAYVIVKHQLLDIKVVIRAGLVYSFLTFLFAGFYVGLVLAANYFFRRFPGSNEPLVMLVVVFISVIIFQPLRDRTQKLVDRLFFMGEYRYQQTINDLSAENRRLFTELLRADKLAALGTMSAGMAHEIKNPLASLKGMTQVLADNLDDPDFLARYQEVVGRQIDRINGIVEQLLKFGQPPKLTVSGFDLNKVLREVLVLFASQCRKQAVAVEQMMEALPPVMGDEEQITQVLTNLVLNAIQAMPSGGELKIKSQILNNGVIIEVADSGPGVPAERLDKIFDPFYTTKEQGSGMGLAVAYRIVKDHHGTIEVASEPGKGTTFTVWLPIKHERSV